MIVGNEILSKNNSKKNNINYKCQPCRRKTSDFCQIKYLGKAFGTNTHLLRPHNNTWNFRIVCYCLCFKFKSLWPYASQTSWWGEVHLHTRLHAHTHTNTGMERTSKLSQQHFHASQSIPPDLSLSLPLTFLGVIVLKRLRALTYIALAPPLPSAPRIIGFAETAGKRKRDSF